MLLSTIVFIPLAGALLVLLAGGRGDRHDREPLVRWLALAASLVEFAATLWLWARFDGASSAIPVRRAARVAAAVRHPVPPRRRRHQPVPHRAHRVPDAAGAAHVVAVGAQEHEGVLVLPAGARDGDARRLRLARPVPLLHLLGRGAHPDVLPHRDLGLRTAHLCGGEVHPLHDGRQHPDARRDHRPRLRARRDRRHAELRPPRPLRDRRCRRRSRTGSSSRSRSRS